MRAIWPARLAFREGLANAWGSRVLFAVLVVVVSWVCAIAAVVNASEVSDLAAAEKEWIDAGGFAYVVEANSGGQGAALDVAACERLSTVEGIGGSFAVVSYDHAIEPAHAPGTQATLISVSPGVWEFFGVEKPRRHGILATARAASTTGLTHGEFTTFAVTAFGGATSPIAFQAEVALLDSAMLPLPLEGSYLVADAVAGPAIACYVRSDSAHYEPVGAYLPSALSSGDTPPIVRPLLSDNAFGTDFATAYQSRVLNGMWILVALVLVSMWGLLQWLRKVRMAIYATFGAPRQARMMIQLTEWATVSIPGVAWGWAIALSMSVGMGADGRIALTQVTFQILAAWCAATIGVVLISLAPIGTLLDALKDRT